MERWRSAEAAPQADEAAVTIEAAQTESLSGTIRGDISFGSGSQLAVADGTALAVFGTLAADGSATVAVGAGATFYAAGAVDAAVTLSLGSGSTLDLAAQELSAMSGLVSGFDVGNVIDIVSGSITSAQLSGGVLALSQDGSIVGTLAVASAGTPTILAVPDPVDGTRLLQVASMMAITAAAPGAGTGETVRWSGSSAGQWSSAGSWQTPSGGSADAPRSTDVVLVAGPSDTALMLAGDGAAATLSTSGIVALGGAFAVSMLQMGQSSEDVLDLQPGATMQASTADLAAGILQISGAQATLSVAGTLTIGAQGVGWIAAGGMLAASAVLLQGGTMRLDQAGALTIGAASQSAGTLCVGSSGALTGLGAVREPVLNDGLIEAAGGLLALYGSILGDGTLAIEGASTLYAPYGAAAGQTVMFGTGASGTLELFASASTCSAAIVGITPSDAIDIASATLSQATWTASGGSLGVLDLGSAGTLSVDLATVYGGTIPEVTLSADGSGGTLIQIVPCFGAQSRVATPSGWRAAGTIRPGMRVLTRSGAARRVRWVGRRDCAPPLLRTHPELRPVRIGAGAVADRRPSRDLIVSPQHGVLVPSPLGGRIVPAIALVDERTVWRDRPPDGVTYIHLELDSHDLVLAEGLETETFLREGSERDLLFQLAEGCPATQVEAAEPRLESGFQCRELGQPPGGLVGSVDHVARSSRALRVSGWVFRTSSAEQATEVAILADGVSLGSTRADRWRPDLDRDSLSDSRSGFTATVPWSEALRCRQFTVSRLLPVRSDALVPELLRGSSEQSYVRLDRPADQGTRPSCPATPPRRPQ